MTDLRYPIGPFKASDHLSEQERLAAIAAIAAVPSELRAAVEKLDDEQLDTPYRPEGWTVRQLVHHVADSHLNAYIRFKLALTEEEPAVKTYDEKAWAEMEEARSSPVALSLDLLDGLHERWASTLRALGPADFERALQHPDHGRIRLERLLALYAWHGRHHVAHVTGLKERMGW